MNILVVSVVLVLVASGNAAKLQSYQLPSLGSSSRGSSAQTDFDHSGGDSSSVGSSSFVSDDGFNHHSTSGFSSGGPASRFEGSNTVGGLIPTGSGFDASSGSAIDGGDVRQFGVSSGVGGSSNSFGSSGHSTGFSGGISSSDGVSQGGSFGSGSLASGGTSQGGSFGSGSLASGGFSQGGSFGSGSLASGGISQGSSFGSGSLASDGFSQGGSFGSGSLASGGISHGGGIRSGGLQTGSSFSIDGCGEGEARRADGVCVKAKITRKIFSYAAPPPQQLRSGPLPNLPEPEIQYNFVVVRTPEVSGGIKPIVAPPPSQKTLVFVLTKRLGEQEQEIIQVPSNPVDPEVFFVNFNEGDNPQLPGGINLQEALQRAQQEGRLIDASQGDAGIGGNFGVQGPGRFDFVSGINAGQAQVFTSGSSSGVSDGSSLAIGSGISSGISGSTAGSVSSSGFGTGISSSGDIGSSFGISSGFNSGDGGSFISGHGGSFAIRDGGSFTSGDAESVIREGHNTGFTSGVSSSIHQSQVKETEYANQEGENFPAIDLRRGRSFGQGRSIDSLKPLAAMADASIVPVDGVNDAIDVDTTLVGDGEVGSDFVLSGTEGNVVDTGEKEGIINKGKEDVVFDGVDFEELASDAPKDAVIVTSGDEPIGNDGGVDVADDSVKDSAQQ